MRLLAEQVRRGDTGETDVPLEALSVQRLCRLRDRARSLREVLQVRGQEPSFHLGDITKLSLALRPARFTLVRR